MTMQELELDFRRTRSAPPWIGRVLLAVAVVFAVDVAISYYGVRQAVVQKELRLAKAGRPVNPAAAAQSAPPDELAAARETIHRLSRPWDNLFGALESVANDKVALLAIQPDSRAGTVVISGESEDYAAVLAYVSALGRAPTLSQVHLVQHELRQDDKQRLAFSIAATWGSAQ
jgi:Tfp pilus assembly protein PilN